MTAPSNDQQLFRRVMVVEQDPNYQKLVEYITKLNPDYEVLTYSSGKECLDNLHLNPNIITVDYDLDDMSGKEFLTKVKKYDENIAVIIISDNTTIPTVVEAIRSGAYNFIPKNSETDLRNELIKTYHRLKNFLDLKKDVQHIQDKVDQKFRFNETIIGESKPVKQLFYLLEKAAKTNITVMVTGETGTGKELVAQAIHYNSQRRKEKFVAVNMAAIPSELLESELFGYEKGAFTGANHRKLGKFEFADKGTLFLDEIGEMDISLQAKLLRALEDRAFVRVGGMEAIPFDVRIIVATHVNMEKSVAEGKFREDLYYRILGMPIELPPLRKRGEDVLILADYFLKNYSRKEQLGVVTLSDAAKEKMLNHSFPGNVRELKSTMELAAVMCEGGNIEPQDIRFRSPQTMKNLLAEEITLKDYTERIIHHYLDKYDDNVVLVAQKLGIGKSTIYRMLQKEKDEEENEDDGFKLMLS